MPAISFRQSPRTALQTILRHTLDRGKTLVQKRVLGRGSDGVEQHLRLDGTCATRATVDSHATGQVVTESAQPNSLDGSLGLGSTTLVIGGALRVVDHQPRELPRGASMGVTITGAGFRPGMTWTYLVPPDATTSEQVNAQLDVLAAEFISSKEVRLTVRVEEDAELIEEGPIAFELNGRPGRAEDLYSVSSAAPPPYFAVWSGVVDDELAWIGALLDAEGAPAVWVGHGERSVPFPDLETQATRVTPILHDENQDISDFSVLQPAGNVLIAVDLATGERHFSQDFGLDDVVGAVYHQEKVFALVHSKAFGSETVRVRLLSMPADLSSSSTVVDLDLAPGDATNFADWADAAQTVAFGRDAAYISLEYADFTIGVPKNWVARLPYDGSPASQGPEPSGEAAGPKRSVAMPYASGGATRGKWRWLGGLGSDPANDPAWEIWTPQDWGAEGGPSSTATALTWDGTALRTADATTGTLEQFRVLTDVPYIHPDHGDLGPPTLIFPAF